MCTFTCLVNSARDAMKSSHIIPLFMMTYILITIFLSVLSPYVLMYYFMGYSTDDVVYVRSHEIN